MRFDEEFEWWKCNIELPVFSGVRITVPGRESTSKIIELRVEAGDDGPMDAQKAAYTYLLESQPLILEACPKE